MQEVCRVANTIIATKVEEIALWLDVGTLYKICMQKCI